MTPGEFKIARSGMKGVGAISADTSRAFNRHTHDQFGIGVIVRGAQKSLSGRGIVEAQAGDVITVNPGEVHDGSPLGESGRAWRMLYFDPATLAGPIRTLTDGSASSAELSRPAMRDPASAACFLSLFRILTDPHGGHSEIEGRENLLLLLARLIERRDQEQAGAPKAINQARERIDDDPSAPLSLGELAAIGGVSQFQLVRGFSKATGLTPHAYLVQRRLQRARKMIAEGAALAEAAQASGFADQSHMTRLFVRTYGMSPGLYAAAMS
ncbi:MAG: AraC family transcriptional regulator [Rhizobiales bacterium 24-66-13]|nr:MAG: AraC family transcriptional regulator [Rhizobiales bacterium 35-66-30]OYZ82083.1 MAG: AraC family transcriptional regulator [Rhizobiales bacterium 24-66-13]OZB11057.1 MAG: AraC family transcriptional regulator [Rhizobiales bacterium 39-66-18]HQS49592.1 AraC family transcriptional regulator [Xanthobacteraceae bacterium]